MHVLLTNDDGFQAEGLMCLKAQLEQDTDIQVNIVAPDGERSSTGHSITNFHKALAINKHGPQIYTTNGSPADCVRLAIEKLFPDTGCVISGINHGGNLGMDVYYSGTVAAAREACFYGIPSLALSLHQGGHDVPVKHFGTAAYYAAFLLKSLVSRIPRGVYLNVNVPNRPKDTITGMRICPLEKTPYSLTINETSDSIHFIHAHHNNNASENTDIHAIHLGYVSISPLQTDQTAHEYIQLLQHMII